MLLEQETRTATELSKRERAMDMAMEMMVIELRTIIEEAMRK